MSVELGFDFELDRIFCCFSFYVCTVAAQGAVHTFSRIYSRRLIKVSDITFHHKFTLNRGGRRSKKDNFLMLFKASFRPLCTVCARRTSKFTWSNMSYFEYFYYSIEANLINSSQEFFIDKKPWSHCTWFPTQRLKNPFQMSGPLVNWLSMQLDATFSNGAKNVTRFTMTFLYSTYFFSPPKIFET